MQAEEFSLHAEIEDEHWWFRARRNIIVSLLKRFSSEKPRHVVEIGCGTGGNLRKIHHYVDKVTGVDVSEDAVAYARDRVPGEVYAGDFRSVLKDKWQDIDVVLIADVLEHVEDASGFLDDIISSMKPGGLIIITVPAHQILWSHHDVVLGHHRRYEQAQLKALWKGRPVRQLYFSPFNFVLSPLVFMLRLLSLSGKESQNRDLKTSDLKKHSAPVNSLLYFLFNLESKWLQYFPLPWGCSYAAVIKKE